MCRYALPGLVTEVGVGCFELGFGEDFDSVVGEELGDYSHSWVGCSAEGAVVDVGAAA